MVASECKKASPPRMPTYRHTEETLVGLELVPLFAVALQREAGIVWAVAIVLPLDELLLRRRPGRLRADIAVRWEHCPAVAPALFAGLGARLAHPVLALDHAPPNVSGAKRAHERTKAGFVPTLPRAGKLPATASGSRLPEARLHATPHARRLLRKVREKRELRSGLVSHVLSKCSAVLAERLEKHRQYPLR